MHISPQSDVTNHASRGYSFSLSLLLITLAILIYEQEHYESPRRSANLAMITALDSVKLAFSLQATPLALIRNAGLDLINALGPVRNGIMKYAMGL